MLLACVECTAVHKWPVSEAHQLDSHFCWLCSCFSVCHQCIIICGTPNSTDLCWLCSCLPATCNYLRYTNFTVICVVGQFVCQQTWPEEHQLNSDLCWLCSCLPMTFTWSTPTQLWFVLIWAEVCQWRVPEVHQLNSDLCLLCSCLPMTCTWSTPTWQWFVLIVQLFANDLYLKYTNITVEPQALLLSDKGAPDSHLTTGKLLCIYWQFKGTPAVGCPVLLSQCVLFINRSEQKWMTALTDMFVNCCNSCVLSVRHVKMFLEVF